MAVRTEIGTAPERPGPGVRWWRRPWVGPLAVVVTAFLAYSLPPYLAMDPARSRVPQPPGFPAHYWFLVAHVLFGTVAIVGVVLQIWPWFRRRYPAGHRWVGRVYVFGGAIPSALMAGTIGSVSPFGPVTGTLDVVAATLWLTFTVAGFRAGRQGRYADHRKWMVRSFAMCMNTLVTRIYTPILIIVMAPPGAAPSPLAQHDISGISAALSVVSLLLFSQLWLDRKRRPAFAR